MGKRIGSRNGMDNIGTMVCRLFDPQRANAIASQKRKDNRFGFPGTVTVFDQKDKVRGVLDGQHR